MEFRAQASSTLLLKATTTASKEASRDPSRQPTMPEALWWAQDVATRAPRAARYKKTYEVQHKQTKATWQASRFLSLTPLQKATSSSRDLLIVLLLARRRHEESRLPHIPQLVTARPLTNHKLLPQALEPGLHVPERPCLSEKPDRLPPQSTTHLLTRLKVSLALQN